MGYFTKRYLKMNAEFAAERPEEYYLRCNTLHKTEDAVVWQLTRAGVKLDKTVLPACYSFTADFSLSSTTLHLTGGFYLQGLASQTVAHALAPEKEWTVIDLAAAPGSKTTHLAQLMNNQGRIIALDKNNSRLKALRSNCARLGVTNVIGVQKDARYANALGIKADAVLLDAPCAGNYCSEDNWEEKRTLEDIQKNARIQKDLIKTAIHLLVPGGVLVYSTCSLEPEEDEMIIQWALDNFDVKLEKIPLPDLGQSPGLASWEDAEFSQDMALAARFWPYKTGTEGFFIARLRKK